MLGPHVQRVPLGEHGWTRRRFLGALSTGTAVAVSGCAVDAPTADAETEEFGNTTDDEDDENTGETVMDVPETFDVSRDTLRGYSRRFIELLENGRYDTAVGWFAPAAPVSATRVETVWERAGGTDSALQEVVTVSYLGNNLGNDVFTLRVAFEDGDGELSLFFSDDGLIQATGLELTGWTPPSYTDPDAVVEEEVSLSTPIDCELGGTITLPEEGEDIPGVVLVHGNGPQDRDGTTGPNRYFKELAWGLASRGIAVLRYDKRTYACEVDHAEATIDDVVTVDALTAVERLRTHDRVADDEILVAGHSFGGLLTPRVAARDGNLAGTVMLAPGPAGSFADTIVRQQRHQLEQRGVSDLQRERVLERARREAEQIRELDIDDNEVVRFGGRAYYRTLQEYDHLETAESLSIPQLLLQGGMDWQVTTEDDLPIWRDALGDEPNVEITVYDDLNHLFQESDGTLLPSEYTRPETPVEQVVVEDIAAFVRDATTAAQGSLGVQRTVALGP